ncbi:MAG: hypothetical protein AAFR24_21115, partial [Cyanobacteria bacterium J06627_3]
MDHIYKLASGIDAWRVWRKENPNIKVDLSNIDLPEKVSREQLTVLSMNVTPVVSAIFSFIFAAICFFYNFQDPFDIKNIDDISLLLLIGVATTVAAILFRFVIFSPIIILTSGTIMRSLMRTFN